MLWATNVNEIVSTHGYQHNDIMIWKYPRFSTVTTLTVSPFPLKVIVPR